MKKLRNIALYYIALTFLSLLLSFPMVLLLFIPLLPFFAIGVFTLAAYYTAGKAFRQAPLGYPWNPRYVRHLHRLAYAFPLLFYAFAFWYATRPYRQTVVLPKGYKGVVAIQYNRPDGQARAWTWDIWSFSPSRLIKVDTSGMVKTRFAFHYNAMPFIGGKQTYYNEGGLKIYYEDNRWCEIVWGADGQRDEYINPDENKPSIYFTDNNYPTIIFVVTRSENYARYLMTQEEMIEEYKKEYNQDPLPGTFFNVHRLNRQYDRYYKFRKEYYEELNH